MVEKIYMKCGHEANAKFDGKPCCVICSGINHGWNIIEENKPNLTNRKCKCDHCKKIVNSINAVAFFEYKPDEEFDKHYDGCFGWD